MQESKKELGPLHCVYFIYYSFATTTDNDINESQIKHLITYLNEWTKNTETSTAVIKETLNWIEETGPTKNEAINIMFSMLDYLNKEGLDKEIKKETEKQIARIKKLGYFIEPKSFNYLKYLVPTYYVISTAEASSNLSRFDGVRFGYRTAKTKNLEETYIKTRTQGFGEEVKRRIMLGNFVLKSEYHDAYFSKAQKIRRLIKQKTDEIFKEFDFILTPTTPHTAFDIDRPEKTPTEMLGFINLIFNIF